MKIDLSDIISLIALLGTVITYWMHSRKLNTQQRQINDFQIKRSLEEEEDKKKAFVRANTFKSPQGWRLRVYNKGEATARNIRLIFNDNGLSKSGIELRINIKSYPLLNKDDKFDIVMILAEGHNPAPIIKLIWDDCFGKDREYEQSLNLTF